MANEVDRIREVFDSYRSDPGTQARWSLENAGNRAAHVEMHASMTSMLTAVGLWPPAGYRILDIGCGTGSLVGWLLGEGAHPSDVLGVDLHIAALASARLREPEAVFQVADGRHLPFVSESFAVVAQSTVFTSILDDRVASAVASEIDRVLKPGGVVLWYDYRVSDPRNPNTRAMRARNVEQLFPRYKTTWRSLTVLPQLARRLGPSTRFVYPLLARLPILRTHLLGLLRKPGDA